MAKRNMRHWTRLDHVKLFHSSCAHFAIDCLQRAVDHFSLNGNLKLLVAQSYFEDVVMVNLVVATLFQLEIQSFCLILWNVIPQIPQMIANTEPN